MYAHTVCTYVYIKLYICHAHPSPLPLNAALNTVFISEYSMLRFTVVIIRMLSSSTLVGYPTTKDKVRVRPTTGRTEGEGCSCVYHPPLFLRYIRMLNTHTSILCCCDQYSHTYPHHKPPFHPSLHAVVYNYVQRPFTCMSWEKDEAKSRDVDFTCVHVKTDIDSESEAATLVGDHLARDPEESND